MNQTAAPALLDVRDLRVALGTAPVLDGVDLTLKPGETLGLVGESGCGKTMTALAVLGLLPPGARVTGGEISYRGRDLLTLDAASLRRIRGRDITMAFQEQQAALDPVQRCGDEIALGLREVAGIPARAARTEAVRLLRSVALPDPARVATQFPHELSGGMCQRVGVALALVGSPKLLIADEVTRGLDLTVQQQILDLLAVLQAQSGLGILLIGHDLAVIAARASRVAVMLGGRIVETGPVDEVFRRPGHPYTRALLRARPRVDGPRRRLAVLPPPDPGRSGPGCPFQPRCPERIARCASEDPQPRLLSTAHTSRCFVDPPDPTAPDPSTAPLHDPRLDS